MTENGKNDRAARRLSLLLARAVARHEFASLAAAPVSYRASFVLLAASTDKPSIYGEMTAQGDSLLKISFEAAGSEIAVQLWSLGFARTNALRNRRARLVTGDAQVDFAFRFDGAGRASFGLERSATIEQALSEGFSIEVFDE